MHKRTAFFSGLFSYAEICGCSLVAKHQLPKLRLRVRFPLPAPRRGKPFGLPHFYIKNTASLYRLPLLFRKKAYSLFAKKAPSAQLFFAVASSQKVVKNIFLPVHNFSIRLFYSFPCQALFAELRTNFRYNKSAYLFLK